MHDWHPHFINEEEENVTVCCKTTEKIPLKMLSAHRTSEIERKI